MAKNTKNKKLISCKKKGYHCWEVIGTNGLIPSEEVDLVCEECGAKATAEVMRAEDGE
jgi:hypothetical protein